MVSNHPNGNGSPQCLANRPIDFTWVERSCTGLAPVGSEAPVQLDGGRNELQEELLGLLVAVRGVERLEYGAEDGGVHLAPGGWQRSQDSQHKPAPEAFSTVMFPTQHRMLTELQHILFNTLTPCSLPSA